MERTRARANEFIGQTDLLLSSVANRSSRSVNGQQFLILAKEHSYPVPVCESMYESRKILHLTFGIALRWFNAQSLNRCLRRRRSPMMMMIETKRTRTQSKIDFYLSNVLRNKKLLFSAFKLDGLAQNNNTEQQAACMGCATTTCAFCKILCIPAPPRSLSFSHSRSLAMALVRSVRIQCWIILFY